MGRSQSVVGSSLGCGHSGSVEDPTMLFCVQLLHLKSVSKDNQDSSVSKAEGVQSGGEGC